MSLFVPNTIERLARGLMNVLSPLTGNRAVGTVRMRATGSDVTITPNTYLAPLRKNGVLEHLLYKTRSNPATEKGEWVITQAGTDVDLIANVGGKDKNKPQGTNFVFVENPPGLEGIDAPITATVDFIGGDSSGEVNDVVFYEDLNSQERARDFFDAKLGNYPAIMVAWNNSGPLEGRTFGASKGATRTSRKTTVQWETFQIYIITSKKESDPVRRRVGMDIMVDATALLTDTRKSPDGEIVNAFGNGIDINQRSRVARGTNSYIYAITCRLSSVFQRCEFRTFNPWILMHYEHLLEADETNPERVLVNIEENIPQDPEE